MTTTEEPVALPIARCASTMDGLQCELPQGHPGMHAAEITRDEDGNVDGAVTWNAHASDNTSEGIAPVGIEAIDLRQMTDDGIVQWTADAMDELEHVKIVLGDMINAGKAEIERRLRENGGRALAHPRAEKIELQDEFSPYVYDLDALRAAAAMLPDDERAKIIKHVSEQVTIIPEHDEPGAAVSIAALIRKYGEKSDVGVLLSQAMTRTKTGTKLAFKLRKDGVR